MIAAAAFLIFGALYIFFGASSYHDIVSFNEQAAVQISRAKHAAIRIVVSRGTFERAFGKESDDADARPESETGRTP